MEVAFETDRFRAFKAKVDLGPNYSSNRSFYVALPLDEKISPPKPWSSALVIHNPDGSHFVDWIETLEGLRRKGIARELLVGIIEDLEAPVVVYGSTEAGIALQKSLERTDE